LADTAAEGGIATVPSSGAVPALPAIARTGPPVHPHIQGGKHVTGLPEPLAGLLPVVRFPWPSLPLTGQSGRRSGLYRRMRTPSKGGSMQRRLNAIAEAHKAAGIESPTHNGTVRNTMKGIRRTLGMAPAQKTAALTADIRTMVEAAGDGTIGIRPERSVAASWWPWTWRIARSARMASP
jgi:hypothetical protein